MRRVVIESPYAGKTPEEREENITYARACVRDSLLRGEAPIASHLLYTQAGILDDSNHTERSLGMRAGFAWTEFAQTVAIYMDRGISAGMRAGITTAERRGIAVEYRRLSVEHTEPLLAIHRRGTEEEATPSALSKALVSVGIVATPHQIADVCESEQDLAAAIEWTRAMHRHAQGETVEIPSKPLWIDTLA